VPPLQTSSTTVRLHIPAPLRDCCRGANEIRVSAESVRAALAELERLYPALYRSVCDETGAVRRHVNVFVNASHMRDCNGFDTVLGPGDVLTILPAVSGG
jgi:molybdopterin converting factor small subunit